MNTILSQTRRRVLFRDMVRQKRPSSAPCRRRGALNAAAGGAGVAARVAVMRGSTAMRATHLAALRRHATTIIRRAGEGALRRATPAAARAPCRQQEVQEGVGEAQLSSQPRHKR